MTYTANDDDEMLSVGDILKSFWQQCYVELIL